KTGQTASAPPGNAASTALASTSPTATPRGTTHERHACHLHPGTHLPGTAGGGLRRVVRPGREGRVVRRPGRRAPTRLPDRRPRVLPGPGARRRPAHLRVRVPRHRARRADRLQLHAERRRAAEHGLITTVEFVPAPDGTRLVLTEQGTFLDGMEQPQWREQGTKDQLT